MPKGASETSTMALLDVDHFKKFNDNYGHLAGDEVLRIVAGLIHSRLSQYGHVARYGGEEFAIVFDGSSKDEVCQLIEQARNAISQRETVFENKSLRVMLRLVSLNTTDRSPPKNGFNALTPLYTNPRKQVVTARTGWTEINLSW